MFAVPSASTGDRQNLPQSHPNLLAIGSITKCEDEPNLDGHTQGEFFPIIRQRDVGAWPH